MPFSHFPKNYNRLPTVSFEIPNLMDDMHDGSIQKGDQWLQAHFSGYVQWAMKHNSLLSITWDEDDNSQDNQVPAIFVGPMVKAETDNEAANHFSLLLTIEDAYHLSHAGDSQTAKPITKIRR